MAADQRKDRQETEKKRGRRWDQSEIKIWGLESMSSFLVSCSWNLMMSFLQKESSHPHLVVTSFSPDAFPEGFCLPSPTLVL